MQKKFEKAIYAYECELEEIDRRTRKRNARVWSQNEKARFFGELKYHAREKGYKPGWAVNQYKSRIGVLPWPVYNAQPVPPSAETRAWIRHKQIQWAKRRTA